MTQERTDDATQEKGSASVDGDLKFVASYPAMRVLAWDGELLYASRGYTVVRADMTAPDPEWVSVGQYQPAWGRNLSAKSRLSSRLFRDGFHALAKLSSGHLLAAVAGAIVRLAPNESEFGISHRIRRGTRPLHIAFTPENLLYWGEYFDNRTRDEVHIYGSKDTGLTWNVAHTFPKGSIRHVHNIVHDPWQRCLWVLSGDNGPECKILRASLDFKNIEIVLSGNQQARAVAAIPTADGLYFSSDTPLEQNYVYRLDRAGNLHRLSPLNASSIYGCRVGTTIFFSTMAEPGTVNLDRQVCVYGGTGLADWRRQLEWKKDRWPMRFFQYGNAMLPDGTNTTNLLAVSTIAVKSGDLQTGLWRIPRS